MWFCTWSWFEFDLARKVVCLRAHSFLTQAQTFAVKSDAGLHLRTCCQKAWSSAADVRAWIILELHVILPLCLFVHDLFTPDTQCDVMPIHSERKRGRQCKCYSIPSKSLLSELSHKAPPPLSGPSTQVQSQYSAQPKSNVILVFRDRGFWRMRVKDDKPEEKAFWRWVPPLPTPISMSGPNIILMTSANGTQGLSLPLHPAWFNGCE